VPLHSAHSASRTAAPLPGIDSSLPSCPFVICLQTIHWPCTKPVPTADSNTGECTEGHVASSFCCGAASALGMMKQRTSYSETRRLVSSQPIRRSCRPLVTRWPDPFSCTARRVRCSKCCPPLGNECAFNLKLTLCIARLSFSCTSLLQTCDLRQAAVMIMHHWCATMHP
jgi:hypothetical protein